MRQNCFINPSDAILIDDMHHLTTLKETAEASGRLAETTISDTFFDVSQRASFTRWIERSGG